MHIHGTADRLIRYDGGPGIGFARIDGPPVPDVNAFWRNADRCAAPAVTIDGAGHQWPGAQPVRGDADPPSPALNATTIIWAFFAAHPR